MTTKERDGIDRLKSDDRLFVYADDVSDILGCNPQTIRDQATRDIRALGFKAIKIGQTVRIPRAEFLRYIGAI